MEFLSLEKEPEPRPPRFGTTEAIVASLVIHVLTLLLFLWLPSHLPEPLRAFLEPKPVVVAEAASPDSRKETLTQPHPVQKPPQRMPLKFTYVKVPNDTASPKNPDARLLSDKDRRARQEMPTPPDVRKFSSDPHSEGKSIDRVKPDPRLAEGPDMPKPPAPAAPKGPDTPTTGSSTGKEGSAADKAESEEAHIARDQGPPGEITPASPNGLMPRPGQGASAGASPRESSGGSSSAAGGAPGAPARSPTDLKQQTEYKFNFSNQGWLKGGAYGTLSFDTQGFPWGDYARQLYVIIRNNWLERIPLAAREGIAGYTCQHFVIARSGIISSLDVTRTSSVPPFNKAASDAIHASSPLPPLPSEFPDPQEGVTFCFYYNMYPGESD